MNVKVKVLATYAVAAVFLAALAAVLVLHHQRQGFNMVATLTALAQREDVWDNRFDRQIEKANSLLADLPSIRDPLKRFELLRLVAQYQLQAGQADGAVALLRQLLDDHGAEVPAAYKEAARADLAMAYLRLGELQNCTWNHNSDSCLFPIQGKGVHSKPLGATEAVKVLGDLLADPQTSLRNIPGYRWLLNIAQMTLGKYPEAVPKAWLIPPAAFESGYDIGRFRDVAISRKADVFGHAGGVVMEDFDNDGHLDLMTSSMGTTDQLKYLHNNGDGHFTDMTAQAGLTGIVGGLNLIQADYDNDGNIDVLVLRGAWLHDKGKFPPSLLHNNGDGTFTDVTAKAGLLSFYPTQTATWADFNNDGLLDLFIGNEIDRAHVDWPADAKNFELYLNQGDGTFKEVGAESGINVGGMIKGVAAGDYNNDGWQDLYVSVLGGPNHLYRNLGTDAQGKLHFTDVTAKAGVAEPIMSFPCWFWDYNNDGWPDIFVSGYSADLSNIALEYLGQKEQAHGERPRLYRNNRDGTFTDVSHEMHIDQLLLSMGANYGDLDNDGWPDFYLGTGSPALNMLVPNRMFRNNQGKTFQDVTTSGGFGHLQKGHGVAFGDVDGDGNQDVFEVMGGAFDGDKFWSALYKNPGHPSNHWIKLRLIGVKANRYAVGARIRLSVSTEDGATRDIYWMVSSGGSFGANSLSPHIGLGSAAAVKSIEIRWPGSGLIQHFDGPIAGDRVYQITEGVAEPRAVP